MLSLMSLGDRGWNPGTPPPPNSHPHFHSLSLSR